MFERDQALIDSLRKVDPDFDRLLKQHYQLKDQVRKAGHGSLPLADHTVTTMKRKKLYCKDRLAAMLDDYKRKRA